MLGKRIIMKNTKKKNTDCLKLKGKKKNSNVGKEDNYEKYKEEKYWLLKIKRKKKILM